MKSWTLLALLVTVSAVFLGVVHAEETSDDFEEQALEEFYNDKNDKTSSVDNALENVNEIQSNDEDESEIFKRTPLWRRRRRRRRRRRGWFRKLKNKFKKIGQKIHGGAKKVCNWLKNSERKVVKWVCGLVNGDEEYPRGISEDETFITEEEAAELIKQGWIQKYE